MIHMIYKTNEEFKTAQVDRYGIAKYKFKDFYSSQTVLKILI